MTIGTADDDPAVAHPRSFPMMTRAAFVVALSLFGVVPSVTRSAEIPRPEHPTPDAVRPHWANLNGPWQFRFDPKNEGKAAHWETPDAPGFDAAITVPFPWESELSGVKRPDYHGVAWYRRTFEVPAAFPKKDRVWLHFGAVDWEADVWVNGISVAHHEGGYTPFGADITDALKASAGKPAVVTLRAFDPTDPSLPTGKQVGWYTSTSGIWQTVWLESRPLSHVRGWAVTTEIEPARASFQIDMSLAGAGPFELTVRPADPSIPPDTHTIDLKGNKGPTRASVSVHLDVKNPKLWTPESPHLYDAAIELKSADGTVDMVQTYFALRTITRGKYGDAPYERILLNRKPVYLRLALDQSFNPKGIYTAPSDEFLKHDLVYAKECGLNGLRIHIKPDEPRRLYWADKLGVLLFEDMPNTWRQNARARKAWESTMREVIARDRNHPSIIAWIAFNETWGLHNGSAEEYKRDADTQQWVGRMVGEIRKLDPSRLVEDQSPCNYDHIADTDLNSWHFYIDNHEDAKRHIDDVVARTEPGSAFNYCPGQKQGTAPLINSEYGGVGAGDGDRDVSLCFRDLTTLLRRQPKIQGYVYTELTDIEWEHNGFANYDRTPKEFGYDAFVPAMGVRELNGADFIGYDGPPARVVKPGEEVTIPLFVSHYSEIPGDAKLMWWVSGRTEFGVTESAVVQTTRNVAWKSYDVVDVARVRFRAPTHPFVGAVSFVLANDKGERVAANFVNLVVKPERPLPRVERVGDTRVLLRFEPGDFASKRWLGPSSGPAGPVWGENEGFFEYRIKFPESVVKAKPREFLLHFEAASKPGREKVDWPSRVSPEDEPQTDLRMWESTVQLTIAGLLTSDVSLEDAPSDARGILSHVARRGSGSYGQLVAIRNLFGPGMFADLDAGRPLKFRFGVPESAIHHGGLRLFGSAEGSYPVGMRLSVRTALPLPADLGVNPDAPLAVDRQIDRVSTVLATGESEKPATWSYTTDDPGTGWPSADFDASKWKTGTGGFGTAGTPGVRVHTTWDTPKIWLRTTVNLPEIAKDDALTLRYYHDEDLDVFVNGKPLLKAGGYIGNYRDLILDPEKRALFKPGPNVIAVSCRQTIGGQGVDLGLTLERAEP